MKLTVRDATYIAVFGALWGALEISLGTYLHAMHIPLTGLIMSAMGMTVALAGRRIIGRNGSLLAIAAVTAALKAVSFGGVILPPLAAILIQGTLGEVATLGSPRTPRWRMALAGAVAVTWSVFHPIVGQGILAGRGIYSQYLVVIERALAVMGMSAEMAWAALGALVLIHLAAGAAAGLFAAAIAEGVARRMQAGGAEAADE